MSRPASTRPGGVCPTCLSRGYGWDTPRDNGSCYQCGGAIAPTEFIVMTANAQMPASCKGRYGRVAVLEIERGANPKMISERARGVVRIVAVNERLHMGTNPSSPSTAFGKALVDAKRLCAGLNHEAKMKRQEARDDDYRRTH